MRVILDTNVLISFLLSPASTLPPQVITRLGLQRGYELILPEELLDELRTTVARKPYLADRINHDDVELLVAVLVEIGVVVPELNIPIPEVTRDQADDYLLAHAVLEAADYIVSGDKDLLVLEQLADTRIVSPAAFLDLLDQAST